MQNEFCMAFFLSPEPLASFATAALLVKYEPSVRQA